MARKRAARYQSTVARERKLVAIRASVRGVTRVLAAVASGVNSRVVRVADHGTSPAGTQRVARRAKAAALEIGVARESSGDSNTGEKVLGVTRVAAAVRRREATRAVVIARALEATGVVEDVRVLEATRVVADARGPEATRAVEVAQARVGMAGLVGSNLTGVVRRASGSRKHLGADGLESDANMG